MSSQKSDFSFFSLFTAGLACLIPFTSAYTQPVGDSPSGNPISQPGLNSVVPVGEPFSVTWQPTTKGTVTLLLLKGPSSNAVPQYAIAEKIPNNGNYAWTPSNDLAPGQTGYGIQLIDDATGQYQYTTQFGISNDDYQASSSGSWPGASTSSVAAPTSNGTSITKFAPSSTASGGPIGTGWSRNVTMVSPTGAAPISTSLQTSTLAQTSSAVVSATAAASTPAHSNAAAHVLSNAAGVVLAAGMAVFAF